MAKQTLTTNPVTFLDYTDERRLDVYISSNLPTTQIFDTNKNAYSPNWSSANPLVLNADVYLDAKDVTVDAITEITWYEQMGTNTERSIGTGSSLTVSTNRMESAALLTYICKVKYNDNGDDSLTAQTRLTFTRVDTGINGADALGVLAQYSKDGVSDWMTVLNTAIHKYVRHSYDGGATWTAAIKMVGEDGTSVRIKGTATSSTQVAGTDYFTLVYNSSTITGAELGDAYLYDGDLYVCADSRDGQDYFINVGDIQGPKGSDGLSSYVFIRYATDANGANMSTTSNGKSYIGVYVSNTNTEPTTASVYTWSKFVGENAKSIVLSGESQVFKISKANTYTPSTIKVTTQKINIPNIASITWSYNINDGKGWTTVAPDGVILNSDTGEITITGSSLVANSIVIKASDGTVEDVFTVYKAFDGIDGKQGDSGIDAPIAFLTNENISFVADADGLIYGETITTNIVSYQGTKKVLPVIGTIVAASLPEGMTIEKDEEATAFTDNEIVLRISVANGFNLGSTLSTNGTIAIPVISPVNTPLKLSWSKINTGAKGDTGDKGGDAYTVMLTNESYIFAGDVNHAYASNVSTQVISYKGSTQQSITIKSVNGKAAAIADTDTGIPGLKFKCSELSDTSPTITFTCTEDFEEPSGAIPIVVSIDGVDFTRMFNYSIAFKGATGDAGTQGPQGIAATSYWLISSASAVQKTSIGTITVTPSTLTFTGKAKTGENAPIDYACRWIIAYSTDGTNYSNLYTSSVNETSKSITVSTTYKTIRVRMYMAGGTTALLDEQIIPVVSDGAKGDIGVGIDSVTVDYGVSTSASTQPTSWQTTIPTVAEGSYLWTRTITDYTDSSMADTVTYTYAKQGKTPVKGTDYVDGTSVTVSSIQYQASTSATTAPTGTWSNSVVTVAEGSYLWTKTTFSDGKVAYGVAKQGKSGSDAYTVILTNESHIFAGTVSTAVASSATTQVLAYKGGTSQSVTIVSVDGKTASTSSTATSIAGLSFACSALSGTSPTITFTCTTSFVSPSGTIPIVLTVDGVTVTKIFTYGIAFKGTVGTPASLVDITPSAYYFKSTTGKDGTFTPDYIYLYPRFQTVTFSKWEYSVDGGTTWVAASGANGLTISTYSSVANTLRIAKTSTLYTDTVTSISFRCVSSTASVYDTVSIAKIYDVVDLKIGGRNLLLNSGTPVTNSTYNIKKYDLAIAPTVGEQYTITIKGKLGDNKTSFSAYNSGGNVTLGALTRIGTSDLYQKTFNWTNGNRTDLDTSVFIYAMPNSVTTESTIEWIKLEKGNKATDWSPAPEDLNNINFQIFAPKGYLLTNELQSLALETFAYEGSIEITSGATFQWSQLIDDVWTDISDATDTTLTVKRSDVLISKSYRCVMTYKEKEYMSTITVQDKTDMYKSIMCMSSNATNGQYYWVLHSLVYSNTGEVDPLLGPISINAPAEPEIGDYWYAVDANSATVTLKKYDDTGWTNSTDTQSLSYSWSIVNDGSAKKPLGTSTKVKVVSSQDFTATATVVCEVSNATDGMITQSSLSLTDASDPIVSDTEPTATVDGQIWIKRNENGTYLMFVWDQEAQSWTSSDMDSRSKVYTSKPSSYNAGDLWITASDAEYGGYYDLTTTYSPNVKYYVLTSGSYALASPQPTSDAEVSAAQYYRYVTYLQGTLLQAKKHNTAYNAADWSPTLRYDNDVDGLKDKFEQLSHYVSITTAGLRMAAVDENDELSPFTALFTSTDLSFYQNSEKLLILANNQLTAPKVVVEDELEVQGSISLGGLKMVIESNGSFSFAVPK